MSFLVTSLIVSSTVTPLYLLHRKQERINLVKGMEKFINNEIVFKKFRDSFSTFDDYKFTYKTLRCHAKVADSLIWVHIFSSHKKIATFTLTKFNQKIEREVSVSSPMFDSVFLVDELNQETFQLFLSKIFYYDFSKASKTPFKILDVNKISLPKETNINNLTPKKVESQKRKTNIFDTLPSLISSKLHNALIDLLELYDNQFASLIHIDVENSHIVKTLIEKDLIQLLHLYHSSTKEHKEVMHDVVLNTIFQIQNRMTEIILKESEQTKKEFHRTISIIEERLRK